MIARGASSNRGGAATYSPPAGNHELLEALRKDGWIVRRKTNGVRRNAFRVDSLNRAMHAALTAYSDASKAGGEVALPCRAALHAYLSIRPADAKTSERIVRALIQFIRRWPNALVAGR